MNRISFFLWLTAAAVLVSGCSANKLTPGEYVRWVENQENKLIAKTVKDGIEYKLQFKPVSYVALLEQRANAIDQAQLKKDIGDFSELQYYTLYISSGDHKADVLAVNATKNEDYFQRLGYFVTEMQNDITLKQGKEKLPCVLYHYERDYNLTPYQKFLIAFRANDHSNEADRTLVLNDRVFNKSVELTIPADAIKKTPELQID
jgi:hypothetical protein